MPLVLLMCSLLAAAPVPAAPKAPAGKAKSKKAPPEPAPAPPVVAPSPPPEPVAPTPAPAAATPVVPTAALPGVKPALKLAAVGLQQVGLTAELAGFYSNHFAQQLTLAGAVVTTPSEIQAVLGLERQRQLIGCNEEAKCMTDIASALGVDGLVTGAIAKVGNTFQFNVKVVDARTAVGLTAASLTTTSESDLLEDMGRAARAMARELFSKLDRAPTGLSAQGDVNAGWVRRRAWIPALGAVVLAGVGVPLMISGNADYNGLKDTLVPTDFKDGQTAEKFAATGQLKQVLGLTLTSVGVAALLGAGAMFLFGGEKDTPVAIIAPLSSGGAVLVLSGALP